jgi:prepilin-type N-terminal cleavage/methylation domain-containing protein
MQRKVAAFTIIEILMVMLISGILLLAIYDGIGTIKKYVGGVVAQMKEESDLLSGVEHLEALFSRADSVCMSGDRYLFYGAEEPAAIWKQDSILIAELAGKQDTVFRTVQSTRMVSSASAPEKVDSFFVVIKLDDRSLCLRFTSVVWDGAVMKLVREQEEFAVGGQKQFLRDAP